MEKGNWVGTKKKKKSVERFRNKSPKQGETEACPHISDVSECLGSVA